MKFYFLKLFNDNRQQALRCVSKSTTIHLNAHTKQQHSDKQY